MNVILNQEALYNALATDEIAGAAIDVWYTYKPEPNHEGKLFPFEFPFDKLENVVLSPHRGASPMDDLKRWNEVIENITRYAEGRRDFINRVFLEREY